jgi:hypothetical protein
MCVKLAVPAMKAPRTMLQRTEGNHIHFIGCMIARIVDDVAFIHQRHAFAIGEAIARKGIRTSTGTYLAMRPGRRRESSRTADASAQKEIDETRGKFLRARGDIANTYLKALS